MGKHCVGVLYSSNNVSGEKRKVSGCGKKIPEKGGRRGGG